MVRVLAMWMMVGCGASTTPVVEAEAPGQADPVATPPATLPSVPTPADHLAGQAALDSSQKGGREGIVRETLQGGGYTYALLGGCGEDVWVAGPQSDIAVGQTATVVGNMKMKGFRSSTLNRTFDDLVFVSSIASKEGAPNCHAVGSTPPAPTKAPSTGQGASPHAASTPSAGQGMGGASRQGTVLETMESGGYRYAHVDFCGEKAWVAAPGVAVEVGQTIDTTAGMTMNGFHSKTLNRTFPQIDFVRTMKPISTPPECG